MIKVEAYTTPDGKDIIKEWLGKLRDEKAALAIARRFYRLEQGNFGDSKPLRDGVYELRVDVGGGYRVYYSKVGKKLVLLLCCGFKKNQDSDIEKACQYLKEYKDRK